MLVEFSVKNFRSFKERQTISFVTNEEKDTIHAPHPRVKNLNLVTSIMGPNASGKSNLIYAMLTARNFIINSHSYSLTNPENFIYQPYLLSEKTKNSPTEFEFLFILNGELYQYGFANTKDEIVEEWLFYINKETNRENKLFYRTEYDDKENWYISPTLKGRRNEWIQETRKNTLLLSIIGTLKNNEIIKPLVTYLSTIIIYFSTRKNNFIHAHNFAKSFENEKELKDSIIKFLTQSDLGISDYNIEELPTAENKAPDIKINTVHKTEEGNYIDFDFKSLESTGTRRLFCLAFPILISLALSNILIIDEMDSNLHPNELKFIIDHFKSKENNPRNVQLIFTNHDVTVLDYLNKNEIYFTDKKNGVSTELYPLTDYENRKDVPYLKRYLNGFYDALPQIKGER